MFSIYHLRGSVEFYLAPGRYRFYGYSRGPAPLFERRLDDDGCEAIELPAPSGGEIDLEGGRYCIAVAIGHEADVEFELDFADDDSEATEIEVL